jgi:hypothetical protein
MRRSLCFSTDLLAASSRRFVNYVLGKHQRVIIDMVFVYYYCCCYYCCCCGYCCILSLIMFSLSCQYEDSKIRILLGKKSRQVRCNFISKGMLSFDSMLEEAQQIICPYRVVYGYDYRLPTVLEDHQAH